LEKKTVLRVTDSFLSLPKEEEKPVAQKEKLFLQPGDTEQTHCEPKPSRKWVKRRKGMN